MSRIDGVNVNPFGQSRSGEIDSLMNSQGTEQPLVIGVVAEIVYDPVTFNKSIGTHSINTDNPLLLQDIPANTVLARIVTQNPGSDKLTVCYPMFSSHVGMPIKVGEQIFIFRYGALNYWLTRVPGTFSVEDVNFSHVDRKHLIDNNQLGVIEESESKDSKKQNFIAPLNDGGINEGSTTLGDDGPDSFLNLIKNSSTSDSQTFEPVPTFLKRPGDLVLQGSNNTLICLGQNRGHLGSEGILESNVNYTGNDVHNGSIDIVVGRGRYLPKKPTTLDSKGDTPIRTAPRTIHNERIDLEGNHFLESDRIPNINTLEPNLAEGDPDITYDSARILLSMQSAPTNAALPIIPWPKGPGEIDRKSLGGVNAIIENSSEAFIKADHLRLIARRQEKDIDGLIKGHEEINGSIRLIKQGTENSESGNGQAIIALEQDGTIYISGPSVVIGSGDKSLEKPNGEGTQIILGSGATEPLVLGNTLKDLLDSHFNDIKTHLNDLSNFLTQAYQTHTHPTGVGPSGPPLVPPEPFKAAIKVTDSKIDGSIEDLINVLSRYGKTK